MIPLEMFWIPLFTRQTIKITAQNLLPRMERKNHPAEPNQSPNITFKKLITTALSTRNDDYYYNFCHTFFPISSQDQPIRSKNILKKSVRNCLILPSRFKVTQRLVPDRHGYTQTKPCPRETRHRSFRGFHLIHPSS